MTQYRREFIIWPELIWASDWDGVYLIVEKQDGSVLLGFLSARSVP
jgi:hypothetical protein